MSPSVLVVDQDRSFVIAVQDWFYSKGWACNAATTAESAAAGIAERSYDVLIADTSMASIGEIVRGARARQREIFLIGVTSRRSMPTAVEALQWGAVEYLLKPVDLGNLWACVCELMIGKSVRTAIQVLQEEREKLGRTVRELDPLAELAPAGRRSPHSLAAAGGAAKQAIDKTINTLILVKERLDVLVNETIASGKAVEPLMRTPRVAAVEQALREAIQVLNQTKTAFRSKTLGALREKLEAVLGDSAKALSLTDL